MADYFIPRPPPFLNDPPPQGDPNFSGFVPAFGPIAPQYGGYVQAPQFLQGRPPGATGAIGPQQQAIADWYGRANAGANMGTPSRQANIYGLPFSLAGAMGRAIWGQGAPYAGMAAPLPIGAQPPTVAGAAAPFNPNMIGRANAGQGNAPTPFNPYALLNQGAQGAFDWLNKTGNATLGPLTPTAVSGGPIEWDKAPGYNWFQQPPPINPGFFSNTIPLGAYDNQNSSVTRMGPYNLLGNNTVPASTSAKGVGSAGDSAPANTGAGFNPWFGVSPTTENLQRVDAARAGAKGTGSAGDSVAASTGKVAGGGAKAGQPLKTAAGIGTTANSGTAPRVVSPQGDSWVDNQGNKHHKDYHINYAYQRLDSQLGQGFTDQFIARMGVDPIRFYLKEFVNDPRAAGWDLPDERGREARNFLSGMAAYAAESDAKFHPGALEDWRIRHGDVPPPPEQWAKWHKIAMSTGGSPLNTGVGENPYGNY